jgi:penicillin-insensitive murein endopeptidase
MFRRRVRRVAIAPRSRKIRLRRLAPSCGALLLSAMVAAPGAWARPHGDRDLPKRFQTYPYSAMSLSVGSPAAGWQLRAKRLRPSADLRIQEKSLEYTFGLPSLVLMLNRTAKQIAKQTPGSRLLVGDLSREVGGPLAGHKSHQSGRDADVGFFVLGADNKPANSKRLVAFDKNGIARDGSGLRFDDYRNWLLVQLWLKDERARLQHVFIASHLRTRLLDFARRRPAFRKYVQAASQLLAQPHNSLPHDDHFHVRIHCPDDQATLCVARAQSD